MNVNLKKTKAMIMQKNARKPQKSLSFMRRSQNFSEKKLHKALRSVQFLVSFISFYFEILSYLACVEKIIRLASKYSVKLVENQLVISSLSDMLHDTLFLL